jgi:2-phosphosulfolactate phosphatase
MAPTLCEWGMAGIGALHGHVAVLVIVDVLSFSTAVDVAVSRGAIVYPCRFADPNAAQVEADRVGAVLAHPRRAAQGQFSLSPVSLADIPNGTKLMLPSPNGARLSFAAGQTRIPVLTACLRNAAAVAAAARGIAGDAAIGVVPAGECWPDGTLRPAVEDLLGAAAVIDRLDGPCSPEARMGRDAYRAAANEISGLIRLSVSGRELVDAGFAGDVDLALELAISQSVPILVDGAYRALPTLGHRSSVHASLAGSLES